MNVKMKIIALYTALAFLATSAAAAADFVIAEKGEAPQATIWCSNAGSEVERHAAAELRDYVRRITGVELPVSLESKRPSGKVIRLSSGEFVDDGFELSAKGDTLRIRGGRRAGVLYGVYELLEAYGGCGWFASGTEVVPTAKVLSVPGNLRDRQMPDFVQRDTCATDVMYNPAFATKLRYNGNLSCRAATPEIGGLSDFRYCAELPNCHTFMYLMPPQTYFRDHPEYFAEIDGIRREFGARESQPCLSNPAAVKIMTDKVLEIVKRHPECKYFGVSQNDNSNYCRCNKCKAVDEEEGSPSGSIIRFVNHVAAEVAKIRPDAVVETLAYSYSIKPPTKTKLMPNVMPCICVPGTDSYRPIAESRNESKRKFADYLRGWGKVTSNLYVWNYVINFRHYTHPFPNTMALGPDLRFFKENGVAHVYEQHSGNNAAHSDFAELKAYLMAKFLWKADQPLEPLLDKFFAAYYGAGAPYARTWFNEIHALGAKRDGVKDPPWIFERICDPFVSDAVYDRGAELWRKACEATKDSPVHHTAARWGLFGLEVTRVTRGFRGARCADYICTLHPERVDAARRDELHAIARSFIVPMFNEGNPPVALCEQPGMNRHTIKEMREFAMGQSPSVVSNVIMMEHWRVNPTAYPADSRRIKDPLAVLGHAVGYPYRGWNLTPLDSVGLDLDGKYRLRAHVRVEREPGAGDGELEAFKLVVTRDHCKEPVVSHSVKLDETGKDYAWYDFGGAFTPKVGDDFDIRPGELADRIHPTCKVFVDRVEWTAVE